MDHRWVVEGRCALSFDVPEDDNEVEFEVVEGEEAGPGTVRDGRVVCPRCGASLSLAQAWPSLKRRRVARWRLVDAYLAAVVEDGSVRPAGDRDLDRFRRTREELKSPESVGAQVPQVLLPRRLRLRLGVCDFPSLFNPRQLLAHAVIADVIAEAWDSGEDREVGRAV